MRKLALLPLLGALLFAQTAEDFAGLRLRAAGPALMSGRIVDIAVDPSHKQTWFVAVASGGVWKTTNAGVTWSAVFQNEGSYSVGALAMDPKNPNTIWVTPVQIRFLPRA